MDCSVFENEIIVIFVGQRFCVALSAWLDGKGIAKLVSAGDGRGGENLFAMGVQLLQKLEFITEEVFFQKDMCDRERRTIPMQDNDFTDIDRRILQNNVFDIKQVMLLALSVDKVIDRTAKNVYEAVRIQVADITRVAPFPALFIYPEKCVCCIRVLIVFFHAAGRRDLQFTPLAVRKLFSGIGIKGADCGKRERNPCGPDFVSRPGSGDAGGCERDGCTQFAHSPALLNTSVAMMRRKEIVDFAFCLGKKLFAASYRANQKR